MQISTSYLAVGGIWKELLIIEGENPPTENVIVNKLSDTMKSIYYTNGIYKSFVDGEKTFTWYIVNSKETVMESPELVQKVSDLENAIAELAFGGEMQ